MVITIQVWFGLTIFRKDFSVCTWLCIAVNRPGYLWGKLLWLYRSFEDKKNTRKGFIFWNFQHFFSIFFTLLIIQANSYGFFKNQNGSPYHKGIIHNHEGLSHGSWKRFLRDFPALKIWGGIFSFALSSIMHYFKF